MRKSRLIKYVGLMALGLVLSWPSVNAHAVSSQELPTGGQITAGSGSINSTGASMTVNQTTNQMVANWNTFNIGSQASVNFVQPSSSSVALNRVLSANPSYIYGNLSANGQVFLLNPSGVIFGPGSSVNVGGLVASSLSLSDTDFLNGNYHFTNGANAGGIINQGNIQGMVVALIAPQVSNQGTISSPGGAVALAAGDDVNLDFTGDGMLTVNVNAADVNALVENKNVIEANGGGMVLMTAQAAGDLMATVVNNDGIIQAQGISSRNGQIYLDGGSQGITRAAGTLDVSNAQGTGGQITVTGDKVLVDNNATLNATGTTGGGNIDVGGGWEGDPIIPQSNETYVAPTALLNASATDNGDGGTVVVRSNLDNTNGATWAEGILLANGGPNGGDGGRIETSGYWLDTGLAQVSASSINGNPGEWLLDPYNVTITSSSTNGSFSSGTWTPTSTGSTVNAGTIVTDLEGGTNVTITTYDGGSGSDIGDLTDNATIDQASGGFNTTLTLEAADTIVINDPISSESGKLNVVLDADNDNGVGNGVGIIFLNASITTNGGNLSFGTGRTATVNGVANTLVGGDTYVGGTGASAISLTTGGGSVNVEGEMIVADTNGLTVNTSGGNVRFYSLLDSGDTYAYVANSSIDWADALVAAQSGTGANVGDTYLATITSRLENAVAAYTADYNPSWLGARRVTGIGTDAVWRWVTGPEGLEDGGLGLPFFTQNGSETSNGDGGTAINGAYSNWNPATPEPNNSGGANLSQESESALQFVGNQGLWNDLPKTGDDVSGYVVETNLANSPVTVNAGAGTVTFSGAVGSNKELNTLTVTGSSIAINGGSVTTAGLQTYNDPVTVGSASTTLTQTNANTDFDITTSMPITNAYGSNASLTIETTRDIVMEANTSISSSTGGLSVTFDSDSDDTNGGAIVMDAGSSISTNGGAITLSGGTNVSTGYAQGRNGVSDASNGISLYNASLLSSGGNIILRGQSAATAAVNSAGTDTAFGIDLEDSASNSTTINSGSGTISMTGVSTRTSGGDGHGIEINTGAGTTKVVSSSTSSTAIVINGTASTTSLSGSDNSGVTNFGTIETTNGGGIQITGTGGPSTSGFTVGIYSIGNILSNSGAITLTGTGGSGGSETQDIYLDSGAYIGYKAATDVTSSSSNITLNANTVSIASTAYLQSSGTLTVQPRTASTPIGISGGSGTLSLPASYFSTNFVDGFSQINIGNSTAGNITVGADTTFNDNIALIGGNINLNHALNAANQIVTLTAANSDTVSGSGNITASSLLLNGSGATYTLNTASDNSVGTIASSGVTAVNYINDGSLIVGAVGGTNGVTATGNITLQASGASADLTLNKPVTTSSGLITLAAGLNFINNNASNTGLVPGTGRYLVYSTDPADTTRGMTSYNKYYNQTYTAGTVPSYASSGNWFLYSIPATITITNSSATINYGDALPTFTHTISGFIDGDTVSDLLGTAVYSISGSADGSGNYVPGTHQVNYASGLTTNFGYIIVSSPGVLTVNPILPSNSSILSTATGVTGTTQASAATSAASTSVAIGPGAGSSSLAANQTSSLITQPMTLTSGTSVQPIALTSNGATMTLALPEGQTSGEEQSGISVFTANAGGVNPDGDFKVMDSGNNLSLTQAGPNTTNAPMLNATVVQTGNFSVNMPDGDVVELSMSMNVDGVLTLKIPAGSNHLDTQSLVLTGLAAAKEKLKISVDSVKSVVISR